MLSEQKVIPSINNMKNYELFLKSSLEYCFIMDFHISVLEKIIKIGHDHHKKVIVHMDLINGLSSDDFGCEYILQNYHADGVISTKRKVLETAIKNKAIAIQRLFLIDSKSFEKGIKIANDITPDYLEILPALAYPALRRVKRSTNIPLIGGGLIADKEDIDVCLEQGMLAVSISDYKLWSEYHD